MKEACRVSFVRNDDTRIVDSGSSTPYCLAYNFASLEVAVTSEA